MVGDGCQWRFAHCTARDSQPLPSRALAPHDVEGEHEGASLSHWGLSLKPARSVLTVGVSRRFRSVASVLSGRLTERVGILEIACMVRVRPTELPPTQ